MNTQKNNGILRMLSNKTNRNWQIDSLLLASAVAVTASSLYFLFFPGGYQGGRNPYYNTVVIFNRSQWDAVHTWAGIAMILIALVHFSLHWRWFMIMGKRLWLQWTASGKPLNPLAWLNLIADTTIALGFFLAAITGIYFLYVPSGRSLDPMILFPRATWDLIHTWSGVAMILAAVVHFVIHWRWVVNVTRRILRPQNSMHISVSSSELTLEN